MNFDAEKWWANKPVKVWVVFLKSTIGRRAVKDSQVMYIRSRTAQGAIKCARENSFLTGRISGHCRLATPMDLGCVETKRSDA